MKERKKDSFFGMWALWVGNIDVFSFEILSLRILSTTDCVGAWMRRVVGIHTQKEKGKKWGEFKCLKGLDVIFPFPDDATRKKKKMFTFDCSGLSNESKFTSTSCITYYGYHLCYLWPFFSFLHSVGVGGERWWASIELSYRKHKLASSTKHCHLFLFFFFRHKKGFLLVFILLFLRYRCYTRLVSSTSLRHTQHFLLFILN